MTGFATNNNANDQLELQLQVQNKCGTPHHKNGSTQEKKSISEENNYPLNVNNQYLNMTTPP